MNDLKVKNNIIGIFWFLLVCLATATEGIIIKFLALRYSISQILTFRSISSLIFLIPFFYNKKGGLRVDNIKLHFFRNIFIVINIGIWFYAVKVSPFLPEAMAIKFLTPILTSFFAIIFLKEK